MQNRIKEWREERGLTLEKLANLCRPTTSGQQISRLEKSERQLTDEWLSRLSAALKVSKSDLLVDNFVPPSFTPGECDLAQNITERRLLRFWRALSTEAQDFILAIVDSWASRFGPKGD